MFNIGPAELLVVLLIALLVLGPAKLPDAARQVGRALGELRRLSSGFQAEMRDALKEPVEGTPSPSAGRDKGSERTGTGGALSAPRSSPPVTASETGDEHMPPPEAGPAPPASATDTAAGRAPSSGTAKTASDAGTNGTAPN